MRHGIVVGLTGQTGAGKSTVAEVLSRFGYKIIKADDAARLATEKGSPVLKTYSVLSERIFYTQTEHLTERNWRSGPFPLRSRRKS